MMTTRPWWSQLPGTNLRNEYNLQTEAQMSLTQTQQFIHITCVNFIHGDLGGKVNIFGGHSTGHCGGGDVHMNTCLILMVTEIELFESVRPLL